MIDRRTFIKATGAATMLWAGRGIPAAAADGSRIALVIGNNAYLQSPLDNPVNDAKAVGGLLRNANFEVDLRLDTSRDSFLDGVERFAEGIGRSRAELGLFYFAGHGAQLAWKNYLLPVDATVSSPDDLAQRAIDLNLLLAKMAKAEGKTFVVILDACRNNPFGASWIPDQRGLSQFDAPVGSLLAYATAPGSVASDGAGDHGLYTGHLLKEFAAPQTPIEDALKRVRLNVRLASSGAQIPWESTSLEENVVLFPTRGKESDEEIERRFEEEVSAWNEVKQSRRIEDWIAYLRKFPTGRFSEIAQVRLNRLLGARESIALASATPIIPTEPATPAKTPTPTAEPASAPPVEAASSAPLPASPPALPVASAGPSPVVVPQAPPAPVSAEAPSTVMAPSTATTPTPTPAIASAPVTAQAPIAVGETAAAAPPTITVAAVSAAQSGNPYSAGTFRLARNYKVGDLIQYRASDLLTGVVEKEIALRVTSVDPDADRVEFNSGMWISDLNGNIQKMGPNEFDLPVQIFPAELQVGKKWQTRFRNLNRNFVFDLDLRIRVRERLSVPAGEFDAFRIEGLGWGNAGQRMDANYWVVPGINPFYVKRELKIQNRGRLIRTERHELVSYQQ